MNEDTSTTYVIHDRAGNVYHTAPRSEEAASELESAFRSPENKLLLVPIGHPDSLGFSILKIYSADIISLVELR